MTVLSVVQILLYIQLSKASVQQANTSNVTTENIGIPKMQIGQIGHYKRQNQSKHDIFLEICRCELVRCHCIAKSRYQQLPLEEILYYIPKTKIKNLEFRNFKFDTLANDSFRDFEGLYILIFHNCSINSIEKNAFRVFEHTFEIQLNLKLNNLSVIEQGTFRFGKTWSVLTLNQNPKLGTEGIKTILQDFQNTEIHSIKMTACGVFLKVLESSFFEPLRYSSLSTIDMAGNTFETVASNAFEPLKDHLSDITLWNFMYLERYTFTNFKKLRTLEIGGIISPKSQDKQSIYLDNIETLKDLKMYMKGLDLFNLHASNLTNLQNLIMTYADSNYERYRRILSNILESSKTLARLDLSGNYLFQFPESHLCSLFQNRMNLTNIALNSNFFSHFPQCMFKGLYSLTVLHAHSNLLRVIQKDLFKDLHMLYSLDLSNNALVFIHPSNIEMIGQFVYPYEHHIQLKINHNSFECNCELKGVRDWIVSSLNKKRRFLFTSDRCTSPSIRVERNDFVHNYTTTWLECNMMSVIKISTISGGSILFVTLFTLLLLKMFWRDIQYKRMIYKARKHEDYALVHANNIEHDAFVSYHVEKLLWVEQDLCNQLENGPDIKFKLIYDDRIMPGGSLFTSLGIAIHNSRKIIFVVSRAWVKDAMNQFEVDMALAKLLDDYRDMIIVLLMEHIPKDEMPDKVKMIIKHNNCLRWSNNEKKQAKFWRDLKLELGKHHFELREPVQEDDMNEEA